MTTDELFIAAISASNPPATRAQESTCSTDDFALSLFAYGVDLATDTTERFHDTREAYGILPVPESDVEHVLDPEICSRAREAYNAIIDDPDNGASSVIVVRIGTRFIVADPEYRNPKSEFMPHVVFERNFKKLAIFAS